MTDSLLKDRRCESCRGGIAPMEPAAATAAMAQLHADWRLTEDGKGLKRDLSFRNFYRTMGFVNALAHIANAEDHHPDLQVGYHYCRVLFTTHEIDGLSVNDFICAAKMDTLLAP